MILILLGLSLELREVVDRSCEAISISNNLTSTSSVFSHCELGSMHDETLILDLMMLQMEKMYMEDDDDATPCLLQDEQVGYMEAPTTSTPTSHERDYQGMGVDVTMFPLVDMMNYDCLHAMDDSIDVTYDSFLFPCDTLFETNVDHVELPICDGFAMSMPCYECFHFSPIVACNMLSNFSFTCVACTNVEMLDNELAPIAFSNFGDVSFSLMDLVPSFTLHSDHPHMSYFPIDFCVVGDVQMKRHFMMDDVFIYRAHNFFIWCLVCAGKRMIMSTSIEHELTIRALEIIHVSCGSNPTLKSCSCFASNKLNNFSCLWFVCNHDGVFGLPYNKHVSLIFHMDDLWVATNMMNTCSFQWLVCNHNDILCMSCHEFIGLYQFGVATNMLKTCSFMWFVCHHDDILDILHCVFLPSSPLIASRMLTNFSF